MGALELFSADLDKHQPGELGITREDYAAIKGDSAQLRASAAAVASATETSKANENTGAGEKEKARA